MVLATPFFAIPSLCVAQDPVEEPVIEYAELQPLATESLLLDVTRTASGRLVAVGERGHIVISDDGSSWRQVDAVPTRSTLTTVQAVGDRLWAGGHDTVIITSSDGGETWGSQYFDPERQQALMNIHFTDEANGMAMGAYGLFLKTSDGGENWIDELVDTENDYHLNDMIRFDDGRRMIAGEAGYSYRSFDDGESWEALDLPYFGSMWGAQADANGCVVFFGLRGHVLESCDFGDTWVELSVDTLSSLSGAASDGETTVIAGNSGVVLVRDLSGGFSVHTHSSGVDFGAALSLGDGRFLLVGEDGAHYFPETSDSGSEGEGR